MSSIENRIRKLERLGHGQPAEMILMGEAGHTDAEITSIYTCLFNSGDGIVDKEIVRRPGETFAALQRRAWPHRKRDNEGFVIGFNGEVDVGDRRVVGVTVTIA